VLISLVSCASIYRACECGWHASGYTCQVLNHMMQYKTRLISAGLAHGLLSLQDACAALSCCRQCSSSRSVLPFAGISCSFCPSGMQGTSTSRAARQL
jgi:hypothetical protein